MISIYIAYRPIMAKHKELQLRTSLQSDLDEWFCESPGSFLHDQEKRVVESLLPSIFGYFALQIGQFNRRGEQLDGWRVKHRFILDLSPAENGRISRIKADPLQLPVATDSVDAILLPHTLDFSPDPHQLLREAERVLIPDGRLLVVGFNPLSLWGLRRMLARKRKRTIPWCGRFLSGKRLQDWLSLLGFDVELCETLMFRPPIRNQLLMQRLEFVESMGARWCPLLGGSYVIQAVKRESTLTPIRPRWKSAANMLAGEAVRPTTRSSNG